MLLINTVVSSVMGWILILSFASFQLPISELQSKLTLKVLVAIIDAQWESMGDVGSARYEPALLSPCPTIRVLCYSN